MLDLVRLCAQEHWPLLVVGNGTNILFADAGVRGIVAHLALAGYRIEERSDGTALLLALLFMRRYVRDELDLGYRHSRFRDQRQVRFDAQGQLIPAPRGMIEPAEIITRLGIQLHHEEPQQVRKTLTRYKHDRQVTEPTQRHAGSIFKDPPGAQASQLIEQAGMKGRVHGRAHISERNPNYMVNVGGASAADVAALIMEAHQAVLAQCGVDLALDVELHGAWQR